MAVMAMAAQAFTDALSRQPLGKRERGEHRPSVLLVINSGHLGLTSGLRRIGERLDDPTRALSIRACRHRAERLRADLAGVLPDASDEFELLMRFVLPVA
jgi:hypothetical protein